MCRYGHLLPGVLLALLAGCAARQTLARGGLEQGPPGQPALGPDGVVVDFAVLECRAGDVLHLRYLNGELWDSTDEQAVDLERKAVLADNGFRVGHLVGTTPSQLQNLLTSPRYCALRWRQILPAGKPVTLTVGRTVPEMRYRLAQGDREGEEALEKAQAYLVTLPELTADGRTRLQFTPQIQYGDAVREYEVAADRSQWMLTCRRSRKTYPGLGWEVQLAPNEYVIIGAATDNPLSLGYQFFLQEDGQSQVQRLLLIRTSRAGDTPAEGPANLPAAEAAQGPPPSALALQASWTAARGSPP
jgi:hypothetical protein